MSLSGGSWTAGPAGAGVGAAGASVGAGGGVGAAGGAVGAGAAVAAAGGVADGGGVAVGLGAPGLVGAGVEVALTCIRTMRASAGDVPPSAVISVPTVPLTSPLEALPNRSIRSP